MLTIVLKRFLLIIFGILLSLVVLELSMRLAGFLISNYQNHKNVNVLKKKSKYKVMCIGESTTAWQYPIQLQEILDKKYPNKFSVIDCGIPGTNLETILDMLNDNIKKYNPDITICMMGINNLNGFLTYYNNDVIIMHNKKYKIKLYFLYIYLKKCFYDNFTIEIALSLFHQQQYSKAEPILRNILKYDSNNDIAYFCLFYIYQYYYKDKLYNTIAYNMALTAINKGLSYGKSDYYNAIIQYNINSNNLEKASFFANKAVNDDHFVTQILIYRTLIKLINEKQKIKLFSKIIANKNDISYRMLAIDALEKKEFEQSNIYFNIADEVKAQYDNKKINLLYKQIVKELINNDIKVICMQYPVRSISSLKNILKDELYYDKITFISNEQNFKEALMTKQYDEIFVDQFGGDFGHCTDLGNTMIAENVANTLEKLIN